MRTDKRRIEYLFFLEKKRWNTNFIIIKAKTSRNYKIRKQNKTRRRAIKAILIGKEDDDGDNEEEEEDEQLAHRIWENERLHWKGNEAFPLIFSSWPCILIFGIWLKDAKQT